MYQLQRRDNGKEGGYRYISFGPLPPSMEERKVLSRNYLLDPKAAFDPTHLVSTTMDGLARIFEGKLVSAPSMALLPNLLLICDTKDARWREQIVDDDMLRASIMVKEGKEDAKYISPTLKRSSTGTSTGSASLRQPTAFCSGWTSRTTWLSRSRVHFPPL